MGARKIVELLDALEQVSSELTGYASMITDERERYNYSQEVSDMKTFLGKLRVELKQAAKAVRS